MDFIPKNKILDLKPDTLQRVRKMYNLDEPGRMKDSINILKEWILKQPHFNKKDFSDFYLEVTIIYSKGSVERAKSQIDRLCTMRTLLPDFFGDWNFKTDFAPMLEVTISVVLPKLTDDHYRVYVCKFRNNCLGPSQYMNIYQMNLHIGEYVRVHDYVSEYILITDFSDTNFLDYLTKLSFIDLKDVLSICIGGYGLRVKGIHVITQSKLVDKLVSMLKQVLSAKLASRLYVHKKIEELYEIIPKRILPKDYGGEERSLKTLQDEWLDVLSSDEHMSYIRDMNTATTNESLREKDKFTELYAGMPGTFRFLNID